MRFSIQLPTCTEGLVNPVPFARPDDFVRLAQAAERLGYDAVWGNDHVTAPSSVRTKWSARDVTPAFTKGDRHA